MYGHKIYLKLGVNLYSLAKTLQEIADKRLVIVGEEYKVNRKGQITRNHNRKYTTKAQLAREAGVKIFFVGFFIDWSLFAIGEQSIEHTVKNTAVNTGIFAIGYYVSAPLSLALGIAWLMTGWGNAPENHTSVPYEEINGFAPQDNTYVPIPDYNLINYLNLKNRISSSQPIYEEKQHSFKQGRR